MGKAFYSIINNTNNKIFKVTILPSGDDLGYTSVLPGESEVSQSKQDILEIIDMGLAGRVAEDHFLGHKEASSVSAK